MLDFKTSTNQDFDHLARDLITAGRFATHEQASQYTVQKIFETMHDDDGPTMALVRIYRLCTYDELSDDLKVLASADEPFYMTLTGTYGLESEWCDRQESSHHKLISMHPDVVRKEIPMFEHILEHTMGVDLDYLYESRNPVGAVRASISGLYHIPEAAGSPYIPAQSDFIKPYDIKSAVGFGGLIAGTSGRASMYALFSFSRKFVSPQAAENFQLLQPFVGTVIANVDEPSQVFF